MKDELKINCILHINLSVPLASGHNTVISNHNQKPAVLHVGSVVVLDRPMYYYIQDERTAII
jgi:hypothetical protein